MKIKKISKILKNPLLLFAHMCRYWPLRYISDEAFLKLSFKAYQGYKLDLNKVETFNEKIQWLKLFDRNNKYTDLTDKYLVRKYVKERIGEQYLIPLLGVWNYVNEINFSKLPNQFVLKCNHDSGSVIICKNKQEFDTQKATKKLKKNLNTQYFWKSREYNYKNIKRKVIAEKYMIDIDGKEINDYKFFCFNGDPKFIQVDFARHTKHIRNYYNIDGTFIPVEYGCQSDRNLMLPKDIKLDEMINIAKKLSKDFIMVRVDLYQIENKIYFGELTFHHGGGFMKVNPFEYDKKWGSYIDIKNVKKRNEYNWEAKKQ